MTFDPLVFWTSLALIVPAELPDKTFIATIVLATRYRHLYVWLGVGAAFAIQVTIAVLAGGLFALLPNWIVLIASSALFAVGSIILIRSGLRHRAAEMALITAERVEVEERIRPVTRDWQAFGFAFGVIFLAEWGDLTQILTAGLAARTGEPISVGLGAWMALLAISTIAVLAGRAISDRIALWRIRLISGAILAALAGWGLWELFS